MSSDRHTEESVVFGINAVQELVRRHPQRIKTLCLARHRRDEQRIAALEAEAESARLIIQWCERAELDELVEGRHQGAVAICEAAVAHEERFLDGLEIGSETLLLVLDGVTDPHNLGACLRSADAAGVAAVIIPKNQSVGLTGTVRKVACGAAETVPLVAVTNLARCIDKLKERGVWFFGAAGEATDSIYAQSFTGPSAIAMGAEGKGLRRLTRERCDHLFHIPMLGQVESLNVSVATGICLFEALRQRSENS